MQVILLEKIRNLGGIGDKIQVKAGFARNYLIPQGKALIANPRNIAEFEQRRGELEKIAAKQVQEATKRATKFANLVLTITMQASEEGKLFGSVGMREIINAFKEKNLEVERSEISLPSGVMKQIGEYEIALQLHSDVTIPVKVNIAAEKAAE